MSCDFICLVLQATGGAITSTFGGQSQGEEAMRETGVNVMIGGLAFQVVSLLLFMLYAICYAWRWHAASALLYRRRLEFAQDGLRWKSLVLGKWQAGSFLFIWVTEFSLVSGLTIASVTIFVRCAFRVAELRDGFGSALANNQVAFIILESTMILIACICLTTGHPGLCLNISWTLPSQQKTEAQEGIMDTDLEHVHTMK
jgi:hypothetical protein